MAFVKKTWKDRIAEFPTRRRLTKSNGDSELVTVAREEGTLSQEGDAFSADNMNDLEKRVDDAINEANSNLNIKWNPDDDYIYINVNGVWKKSIYKGHMNNLYLLENGNVTDEWSLNNTSIINSVLLNTVNNLLVIKGTNSTNQNMCMFDKSINANGYKKLVIEFAVSDGSGDAGARIGFTTAKPSGINDFIRYATSTNTDMNTVSLDITGYDNIYICAYVYSSTRSIQIKNMYLE